MSAVGCGARSACIRNRHWNNPEPEIVLAVNLAGRRSWAPRSATTSTCAISKAAARCCSPRPRTTTPPARSGPFMRLFDDDLLARRRAQRPMSGSMCDGADQFALERRQFDARDQPRSARPGRRHHRRGASVSGRLHAVPRHHVRADQGSRRGARRGFTHKVGDLVSVSSPKLGRWSTRSRPRTRRRPGPSASRALMRSLAARGTACEAQFSTFRCHARAGGHPASQGIMQYGTGFPHSRE